MVSMFAGFTGCASKPAVLPATMPGGIQLDSVLAICYPPAGWSAEPLKNSDRHTHQIWISPSRDTAYGVAHFSLPIPIGSDFVLWFFLREMKRNEGRATLVSKESAPELSGLRFEAIGGLYHVRANMILHGRQGWVVYAATAADRSTNELELKKAIWARNETIIAVP